MPQIGLGGLFVLPFIALFLALSRMEKRERQAEGIKLARILRTTVIQFIDQGCTEEHQMLTLFQANWCHICLQHLRMCIDDLRSHHYLAIEAGQFRLVDSAGAIFVIHFIDAESKEELPLLAPPQSVPQNPLELHRILHEAVFSPIV